MASASFRESMNSLGWSRRDADVPVNTSQQSGLLSSIKSLNPFGDGGYVRLPTTEGAGAPLPAPTRREEEEGWFVCESIKSLPFSGYACTRASFPFCPGSHPVCHCISDIKSPASGCRCRTCAVPTYVSVWCT